MAQRANTAQAYKVFVTRHPDGELASVARQRIAQLTEEAAWQQAVRANTPAAYRDYLAKYPNGSWSQDARIRMESRSLAAERPQDAPAIAEAAPAAMPAPAPRRPAAPAAPAHTAEPQPPAAVTPERPAVQLGAFSSAANAHNAWSQLSARFRPELGGLRFQVVPVTSSGRRLYRLEARVTDGAAARKLCRELAQHSQGCLPMP